MELTAYLHPGWAPLIRPAPATRAWMDNTPESFAYRCLPLNIANAHGWEILSPSGFSAIWNGGPNPGDVTIEHDQGGDPLRSGVSLFGQGIITFHIEAIMRTEPGWNLWIGGSPNRQKDAVAPLTAVVETDWSPFTFTMNWRFTRPGHRIRFEANEPICFFFPVRRDAVETFVPRFAPLGADPATEERFQAWSRARDAFHAEMQRNPPKAPADRWQKHYYRGVDVQGKALIDDHRAKLRLTAFDRAQTPHIPPAPNGDIQERPPLPISGQSDLGKEVAALKLALAKRDWLLNVMERQRDLSHNTSNLERRRGLSSQEFLERYYIPGRPVVLVGEMDGWRALTDWSPDYLKAKVGPAVVQYQGGRNANDRFEVEKDRHLRTGPFTDFIEAIQQSTGNDAYLTAYNSSNNHAALAPLSDDLGFLDKFLTRDRPPAGGMMWIGPAGTFTPLHHDLTNNFIAQIVGRKRLKLLPAAVVGKLRNYRHVFSEIADLDDPAHNGAQQPSSAGRDAYEVVLEPGEILFVPIAWWHQVTALDFSVTMTYTNFLWPNNGYEGYPAG